MAKIETSQQDCDDVDDLDMGNLAKGSRLVVGPLLTLSWLSIYENIITQKTWICKKKLHGIENSIDLKSKSLGPSLQVIFIL